MKETRRIGFNPGRDKLGIAVRLLEKLDLLKSADLGLGVTTGLCTVELDVNDPRLPLVLDALHELNADPTILALREFTEAELDEFPWLRVVLKTASGLNGGVHFEQPYDDRGSCSACGAGVTPQPPLRVDLSRMGSKRMERLAYEGHLVVAAPLASELTQSQLGGIEFLPVCQGRKGASEQRFKWMKILSEWPAMSPKRILEDRDLCLRCGRAGHFDTYDRITEFHYPLPPSTAQDFNQTWEYFGVWRHKSDGPLRPVGGSRELIVSQRARRVLLELKLKRLAFQPIYLDEPGKAAAGK